MKKEQCSKSICDFFKLYVKENIYLTKHTERFKVTTSKLM